MRSTLFVLLTLLLWGIAPILEKAGLARLEPVVALSVRSFAISLLLLGFLGFSGNLGQIGGADWRAVLLVVIGGVVGALLGQISYYQALKFGEVSRIVPLVGAFPLVTVLLSRVFLGEPLSAIKFVGAGLIVVGVLLVK